MSMFPEHPEQNVTGASLQLAGDTTESGWWTYSFLLDSNTSIKKQNYIQNGEVFISLPNKMEEDPEVVSKDNVSSNHLLGNQKCVCFSD